MDEIETLKERLREMTYPELRTLSKKTRVSVYSLEKIRQDKVKSPQYHKARDLMLALRIPFGRRTR